MRNFFFYKFRVAHVQIIFCCEIRRFICYGNGILFFRDAGTFARLKKRTIMSSILPSTRPHSMILFEPETFY